MRLCSILYIMLSLLIYLLVWRRIVGSHLQIGERLKWDCWVGHLCKVRNVDAPVRFLVVPKR